MRNFHKLDEAEGRELFACFKALMTEYKEGRLQPERIQRIVERSNVAHKIEIIRKTAGR